MWKRKQERIKGKASLRREREGKGDQTKAGEQGSEEKYDAGEEEKGETEELAAQY